MKYVIFLLFFTVSAQAQIDTGLINSTLRDTFQITTPSASWKLDSLIARGNNGHAHIWFTVAERGDSSGRRIIRICEICSRAEYLKETLKQDTVQNKRTKLLKKIKRDK